MGEAKNTSVRGTKLCGPVRESVRRREMDAHWPRKNTKHETNNTRCSQPRDENARCIEHRGLEPLGVNGSIYAGSSLARA